MWDAAAIKGATRWHVTCRAAPDDPPPPNNRLSVFVSLPEQRPWVVCVELQLHCDS